MFRPESAIPNGEESKIILVRPGNQTVELTGSNQVGADLLGGIKTALIAAINGELIQAAPFALEKEKTVLPTPEELVKPSKAPITITVEHTLELATAAYKANLDNPELLTDFNQAFWNAKRQKMGLAQSDLVVSPAPYISDQIREFMGADFALYVPQVVSTTPDGLILLGKGWPEMGSSAFQEGNIVKNEDEDGNLIDLYGWMRTEKAINAPYTRTNEAQARKAIGKNRVGDTLNIYGIAGQQSKLLVDQYLDEVSTWVRVLSSRYQGRVLLAYFLPHGYCFVYWSLEAGFVHDILGARSVEVAKT